MSDLEAYLAADGPAGLFTRLARVGLLLDEFQHACLDRFGLRFIDFSVLRVVDLAGELTPSELAELTFRSTGGITQIVDRLVNKGLAKRTPSSDDRRKVVVRLTAKGRTLVGRAHTTYAAERERLLAPLTAAETVEVDAAVSRLLELFEGGAHEERVQGLRRRRPRAVPAGPVDPVPRRAVP